jgi:uncharacterized protein (TIGR01777 family)
VFSDEYYLNFISIGSRLSNQNLRKMNVLITGGSGLIGSVLSEMLLAEGHQVSLLSRSGMKGTSLPVYTWNSEKVEIPPEALEATDCIIHLAGANIGKKRWTAKRRQEILDSRTRPVHLLFARIKEQNIKLKTFISSSAIGFYGLSSSEKIYTEKDPPASDFLGQVCSQWEQAAEQFAELGARIVQLRTGVVLTRQGGALTRMLTPVKLGLGSALGSGRQYLPWIHVDDLCRIYIKAMEDQTMLGAYNAVAPEFVTNKAFTRTLARVLRKPFWFPKVPAAALKILFGKMGNLVLEGSRVSADKIEAAGYTFRFPLHEMALKDLLD